MYPSSCLINHHHFFNALACGTNTEETTVSTSNLEEHSTCWLNVNMFFVFNIFNVHQKFLEHFQTQIFPSPFPHRSPDLLWWHKLHRELRWHLLQVPSRPWESLGVYGVRIRNKNLWRWDVFKPSSDGEILLRYDGWAGLNHSTCRF